MNCPNCNADKLLTIETYQTQTATIRTKKCRQCEWRFTSKEEISDSLEIPKTVRNTKRRKK